MFSNNYQKIQINGVQFQFGAMQAKILRQLHEAQQTGNSWVFGKTLLRDAGSTCNRLRDVFKTQPVWKELIVSDGRGHYCLNLRAENFGNNPPYVSPKPKQQEEDIRKAG